MLDGVILILDANVSVTVTTELVVVMLPLVLPVLILIENPSFSVLQSISGVRVTIPTLLFIIKLPLLWEGSKSLKFTTVLNPYWADTGSLLPGHGGMLDRMDAFMITIPVIYIITKLL